MKNTNQYTLDEMIAFLEKKQAIQKMEIMEEVNLIYTNIKPFNILKNAIVGFTNSTDLKNTLLDNGISLVAGFLTKKATVGNTHNPLKMILGNVIQLAITSMVARNTEPIKMASQMIYEGLVKHKESN